MLTALHAQMTAGKGCPLQFHKTTSFPWDRDENLIDHHVKLLQLTFSHSECRGTWTWPETQESIQHTSAFHAIPFALTPSPNAQYSLPKCCLLVPPTERAMLARAVQLARLRVKKSRTENTCIFWCCGMHLHEKLGCAGDVVLRGKCGVILHFGCPTLRRHVHVRQNKTILPGRIECSISLDCSYLTLLVLPGHHSESLSETPSQVGQTACLTSQQSA